MVTIKKSHGLWVATFGKLSSVAPTFEESIDILLKMVSVKK